MMLQGSDNEVQQPDFLSVDNSLIFPSSSLNNVSSDLNFSESLCQQGSCVTQDKDYNFGSFPCNCTSLQGNFSDTSWNMGYQLNGNQYNPSTTCCLLDHGKRQSDIVPPQLLNELETAPFVKDFIDSYSNVPKPGNAYDDCRIFMQPQNINTSYNTAFPSQDLVMYPPYTTSNSNNFSFCLETDCLDKLCSPSKNNFSSCLVDQNPIDIESIRPDPISRVTNDATADLTSLIGLSNVGEPSVLRGNESEDESDIVVEDSDTESEVSIDVGPYIGDKEVEKVAVMRCFVCNLSYSEQFQSNFVQVNSSFPLTFITQTPVMLKLIEIIPIDMQTSVKFENNLICRRCLDLIDMIDNLEVRLMSVKKAVCDFVSRASRDGVDDDLNLFQGNSDLCINFENENGNGKDIPQKEVDKAVHSSEISIKTDNLVSTGDNTEDCDKEINNKNKGNNSQSKLPNDLPLNESICTSGLSIEKKYQCERCGKLYRWENELNCHLRKHAGQFNVKCVECGKGFMKLSNLELHLRKHRAHVCLNCRASFNTESDLTEHIPVCEENKFLCNHCPLLFKSEEKLQSHLATKHKKEQNICTVCSKLFKHPSNLEAHMHSHSEEKPFPCDKCGRTYKNQSHLRRHQKSHDKPHDCSVCRKTFSTLIELQRHSSQHTKFKCDLCDKVFSTKANLLEHKKKHMGTQTKKECPVCKKNIVSNFKAHVLSHSEEKAFKCKICDTCFTFKHSLAKHMKLKHIIKVKK